MSGGIYLVEGISRDGFGLLMFKGVGVIYSVIGIQWGCECKCRGLVGIKG